MGDIIGHKDRQIWLPSHVLQDPLFDHSNKHQLQKFVKNDHHHGNNGFRRPGAPPLRETFPLNYNTRQKQQNNWQRSKGEDRMQAFFLVSPGRTTSGTGVFLPATASQPQTKKPACSPVLLPARVVQALNLNVHNNGIHICPRSEIRENDSKKKSKMVETPMNIEVETPIDSPEKLLPEEWTY
ncbi:hypothetical protein EUTSA_v10029004mg [Eutrema salsugineum]|uniref:Uncharacterized protein n=1 Tax=Eutrema salsugineum TaxID=72664 RepID=V4MZ95_EUTSA|nr:uncharacterized protein LOC18014662 [Eutrema salsugineum]ESQ37961.1 hypothetical protein EUTSA_v10029004mg [Eutrema salsugineum]